MDATLIQSIKALASYAAKQHTSFRNSLLKNCRQLAMEPEALTEELRLLRENPELLQTAEILEQCITPNNGPKSWVVARSLTEMLEPIAARNPERAQDIVRVLKAEAANRMAFEAIDTKHAAAPTPAKPAV